MTTVLNRKNKTTLWKGVKRRMIGRLKDMDSYIDFCIARFLVWREVHRREKQAKHDKRRKEALA